MRREGQLLPLEKMSSQFASHTSHTHPGVAAETVSHVLASPVALMMNWCVH